MNGQGNSTKKILLSLNMAEDTHVTEVNFFQNKCRGITSAIVPFNDCTKSAVCLNFNDPD
jgi:hypothetical protein